MRTTRVLKRVAVVAAILLVVAAGLLYLLASWVPGGYQPSYLSHAKRQIAANEFITDAVNFASEAQSAETSWQLTEQKINDYLASIDDIAAYRPSVKEGEISGAMAAAGLAEPAVALDDSVLVFMIRLTSYGKVVSADLSVEHTDQDKLRVTFRGARIGCLPVPRRLLVGRLAKLKRPLLARRDPDQARGSRAEETSLAGFRQDELSDLALALIRAVEEQSVEVEPTAHVDETLVRFVDVKIEEGSLTLRARPVRRIESATDRR